MVTTTTMRKASGSRKTQNIEEIDPDDGIEFVARAKKEFIEEQARPAFPLEDTSPAPLIMLAHIQRQIFEGRLRPKEKDSEDEDWKQGIRTTFIGHQAHFSSTPLQELTPG